MDFNTVDFANPLSKLIKENTYFVPVYQFTIPLGGNKAILLSELLKLSMDPNVQRDPEDLHWVEATTTFIQGDLYDMPAQTIQNNFKKLCEEGFIKIKKKYFNDVPHRFFSINYVKIDQMIKDWNKHKKDCYKKQDTISINQLINNAFSSEL